MSVEHMTRIARGIAEGGIVRSEILVLALVAYDIVWKKGGSSQEGGYSAAISAVTEALGQRRGDVEREVVARLARRSCVVPALGVIANLRDLIESLEDVACVAGFAPRNPVDHVILSRKYAMQNGIALPVGEVSMPWRKLLEGLVGMGVSDPGTLALLVRSRNVGMIGHEELLALDDDDADVTVMNALHSRADAQSVPSVQEFLSVTLEVARNLGQQVQHADYQLYSFREVTSVQSLDRSNLPTWLSRIVLQSPEVKAPWSFSHEGPSSMRWRMGPGEEHIDAWLAFWHALDANEQSAYLKGCDVPDEWLKWIKLIS